MISEETIDELRKRLQGKQQSTWQVQDQSGKTFTIQLSEGRAQNLNLGQTQQNQDEQQNQQNQQNNPQQRRQRQVIVTEVQSQPLQNQPQQY